MSSKSEEVERVLESLTASCNISHLHQYDQERVVETIWRLAEKNLLYEVDIPKLASEKHNWQPHALTFLKEAVDVIDVMYPAVQRGDIKL